MGVIELRLLKVARDQCLDRFIIRSLNPQEVGMAIQSIGTAVQVRDIAGDHLFVAAG